MKAISFPYAYTRKKRVKARRVLRTKYWNKKGKRKSSFVKDYFPSINLPKHHGFLPRFSDDQEAIFLPLPTASSICPLNHEEKRRANVFTLVNVPQKLKNKGPEIQIPDSKITLVRFLPRGSRVTFLH